MSFLDRQTFTKQKDNNLECRGKGKETQIKLLSYFLLEENMI